MGQVQENAPLGCTLWARGLGLWADQDAADGYLGRGQTTGGAALGADYVVSDWLILGLATGTTRTDVSWSRGNYDGRIDAMHTGAYAQADFNGLFARLLASYARLSNSATRPVSLLGYSADAKADFDADLYAASLAVGYQARYGPWRLEPQAGLNYQRIEEQGFSENGADYLNMHIAERDTDSLLANLGIRATRLIQAGGWKLLPRLGLAWQHQLGDERPSLQANFIGYGSTPFNVNGAEFIGDAAVAELGLGAALDSGLEFFADYRVTWADDYLAQALSAGLMYCF
jgi:outer membrane autotransporter protein